MRRLCVACMRHYAMSRLLAYHAWNKAAAAFKAAIASVDASSLADDAKAKLKKDIEKVMRPLAAKVNSSTQLEDGN